MSLSLINDFEVRCNGDVVDLPPSAQRLVCFLALHDRPVRRTYVSGTLWFDTDESRAGARLRSALWRLSSAPGLDLVRVTHSHLRLSPDVRVDVREMTERGLAVLSSRLPDDDLLGLARDLVAVGDDLLAGWYDDWVLVERERFRQIRLHALDWIGTALAQRGRYCDALQVGLAAVRAEPLRESAHRLLVEVHLSEGNVAEAVRQYRCYSDLLRQELGTRPTPVIQALLTPYLARSAG